MPKIVLFNGTTEKDGGRSYGGRYVAKTLRELGHAAVCEYTSARSDTVIGWGFSHSRAIINGGSRDGKYYELRTLRDAGVSIPAFSETKPRIGRWLGRTSNHSGGTDLLNPPRDPAFYTEFVPTTLEYRIHVFINPDNEAKPKIAVRVKRRDDAHPWMRNTWDGGWDDRYEQSRIIQETQTHRVSMDSILVESYKAIRAMGYAFGAVDIAWTGTRPVVWEVNSQPYIPGDETAKFYAKGIEAYL